MEQKNCNKKNFNNFLQLLSEISNNLIEGATKFLESQKIVYETISVPGSLEIPLFLKKKKDNFIGYIILGCIIKGETDHYDVVKNITISQIYNFSYENNFPISNAILTVDNYSQALERSRVDKKIWEECCQDLFRINR